MYTNQTKAESRMQGSDPDVPCSLVYWRNTTEASSKIAPNSREQRRSHLLEISEGGTPPRTFGIRVLAPSHHAITRVAPAKPLYSFHICSYASRVNFISSWNVSQGTAGCWSTSGTPPAPAYAALSRISTRK